eukprot:TRINITY_DN1572_c0_g1_i1.p1 TRINITY_DN1572_c0_g1~~TRINITY_DN1572_c0_g1_i1.p1  ORF type:complete len:185 (+),score=83.15 TRINITY_DN1572_c0_g1_i1:36-590(+)
MATNDPKLFFAFANGVYKSHYEKDAEMTTEYLKDNVFSSHEQVTLEELEGLKEKVINVLKRGGYEDWELNQLETHLKEESQFTETQQESLLKLWKLYKSNIHEKLYLETQWNNSLEKISWRVDTKMKNKKGEDLNDLTSIVEMVTKDKEGKSKAIRFEMDRKELAEVLKKVQTVQKQLNTFAGV